MNTFYALKAKREKKYKKCLQTGNILWNVEEKNNNFVWALIWCNMARVLSGHNTIHAAAVAYFFLHLLFFFSFLVCVCY